MNVAPVSSDGRPGSGAAIGVVPVLPNDPDAPGGCAALRTLRGRPLLAIAVDTLRSAGVLARIVVVVPRAQAAVVRSRLGWSPDQDSDGAGADRPDVVGTPVELLEVEAAGLAGVVLAALPEGGPDRVVVVHDPLHALAPADLTGRLLDALTPQAAGVVPVRAVTDTLKLVDGGGAVTGTADRERFRVAESPQAYRRAALVEALAAAPTTAGDDDGPQTLPERVRAAGREVLLVPAPEHVDRLATADDVTLAEADLDLAAPTGQGIR